MKRKSMIITVIIIAAAMIIGLSIFLAINRSGTPLAIKMYGAEIRTDGTVIETLEFDLNGIISDGHTEYSTIFLEAIHLSGLTLRMDYDANIYDELSEDYYWSSWISYISYINRYANIELYLSTKLDCCCIIVNNDRYFIGSLNPNYDSIQILEQFELSP